MPQIPTTYEPQLTFKRDFRQRRRLFPEESFQHPARTNLNLLLWIVDRYTQAGDRLLDPMGGVGSLLIAATLMRNVQIVDLEPRWIELAKAAIDQIQSHWIFDIGDMQAEVGDATKLDLPTGSVDAIITSPPYWNTFSDQHLTSTSLQSVNGTPQYQAFGDSRGRPSEERRQIGNIHVYELYLQAMFQVWSECRRVLRPSGRLVVIVKDRVHNGRRIRIVADTVALLQALGFQTEEQHNIHWPNSFYRNIHQQQRPNAPSVDTEWIYVLTPRGEHRPKQPLAFVTIPKPKYDSGSAPATLYQKSVAHARAQGARVVHLSDSQADSKALERRRWCFGVLRRQVAKGHLRAGTQAIAILYTPQRYTPYFRRRLETLNCTVREPLKGLNMGQKLAWLTDRGF